MKQVGSLLSYVLWLRATDFGTFVVSRIVGGLSKASVNVAVAIATDVYPPEERGKAMALIGICYSVGFLIGPSIGAYFAMQVGCKHYMTEERGANFAGAHSSSV